MALSWLQFVALAMLPCLLELNNGKDYFYQRFGGQLRSSG
jgi:hypothetical protein